jgi:hypothetical protein
MSDNEQTLGVHLFHSESESSEKCALSYDASTGLLGFGRRYGEQSINGKPLHAAPLEAFWGSKRGPLYDPFLRPLNFAK